MKWFKSYQLNIKQYDAIALAVLVFIQSVSPSIAANSIEKQNWRAFYSNSLNQKTIKSNIDYPTFSKYVDKIENVAGGPSQPEVQSFSPVGSDNLVDPFSGDFSYNIPLLDVDGYPFNIAYNAGVSMEQEASWVGLGWNLNPGVINRNLRGIPDDFDGTEKIKEEINQKPNVTYGATVGLSYELFGLQLSSTANSNGELDSMSININANVGLNFNNYNGFESEISFGPSFSISKKFSLNQNLSYSGSSQGGASIGHNIGVGYKGKEFSNGLNIGTGFNSRQGFQQISINHTLKNTVDLKSKQKINPSMQKANSGSSFSFGQSTFSGKIPFEMESFSITGKFNFGPDVIGSDITGSVTGFFSKSKLKSSIKELPAYGYAQLNKGQGIKNAMLDFSRDKDGSFTKNTPALPIPHLLYDIYSVSGHGISGSYRMDRSDIGHVFDPEMINGNSAANGGVEIGAGGTAKIGADIGYVRTDGRSGNWSSRNLAISDNKFRYNSVNFREANELSYDDSDEKWNEIGKEFPALFKLYSFNTVSNNLVANDSILSPSYTKTNSFRQNKPLIPLSILEIKNGFGLTSLPTNAAANILPDINHQIGAFSVINNDGARYYYGLPAYNYTQINTTFAIGDGETPGTLPNPTTNLVNFTATDASIENKRGIDNYFNEKTTPNYVHSYLLTAYLSSDYIDSDNITGPSKGDIGNFVEFKYKQIQNFKWRNPIEANKAFFDNGLMTDKMDDKANFIYGEKELWYLDTVKTKNHILIFHTSKRLDAISVNNKNGGLNAANEAMLKLDSLILYARPDFESNGVNAKAIKKVHFRYDYSLCKNFSGNINSSQGKLTLTKLWFTYEKSYKGERTPYEFTYGFNPNYNTNHVDRWGTYKPNPTNISNDINSPIANADYPYTGFDKVNVDTWAEAWNLKTIKLPTGGRIEIDYESDDYAYVQHKKAAQMFKIVGVEGSSNSKASISDNANKNRKLFFEMIPGTNINDYIPKDSLIYFRAFMNMDKDNDEFDYVPGYAKIDSIGVHGSLGFVKLRPARLNDNGSKIFNPISVAGIQYARNYLSRIIPPSNQTNPIDENSHFVDALNSLAGAFASFQELFTGPNRALWSKDIATVLYTNKSWIRLNNPNDKKLGGGHRVKEIRTYDAWNQMTTNGKQAFYGQQYIYEFDGKSTGVASYEPLIGGDENAWKIPITFSSQLLLAPDDRNYLEEPFGEQLFPSATVGYSKVLIRNIKRNGVKRTATGQTINEFYTSKDFPTIVRRTKVETKNHKANISLLIYSDRTDYLATSQGFVVENNDMNGKPKSVQIFAEGQVTPYSVIKYHYKSTTGTLDELPIMIVDNNVKLITSSGQVKNAIVGRTYEAVSDFRENTTTTIGGGIGANLNSIIPFLYIPVILGSNFNKVKVGFRSAVFVKSIERKGILIKTEAIDYNAKVTTENLAFDYETGEVLLTSVNNGFNDTIYNLTYPAHWIYKQMGPAYKNSGYEFLGDKYFNDGYATGYDATKVLVGDEIIYLNGTNYNRAWITESSPQGIRALDKSGSPINGTISYIKVVKSGNKNLQSQPVGTITLLKNPLTNIRSNIYSEVLTAQGIEYGDNWKSYCDCPNIPNQNPYTSGRKGNWSPLATYTYLTNRSQSNENKNTNIRKDGVLTSFNSFFKQNNGSWSLNKENWTYTSEVVNFSPFGQPLETKDALNRYSSAHYGYNQTLNIAQVSNAELRESGFDNFEDYAHSQCADNHFKLGNSNRISDTVSHSGKYSLTVSAGNTVLFQKQIVEKCSTEVECDFAANVIDKFPTMIRIRELEDIQFDYEIIAGNTAPIIGEDDEGIYIYFGTNQPYHVLVKLSRSNGCSTIIPIIVN